MLKKYSNLQFNTLKQFVIDCLNNLQSQDIVCIKINGKNNITDFMIICTGQSNRHIISIAQDVSYKLRNIGVKHHRIEGLNHGEWILIDLGDIIIHLMQKETRQLYRLENLWS